MINLVFRTKKTLLPEALRECSEQLTLQDWSYSGSKGELTLCDIPAHDCDFTLTFL